MKVPAHLRNIRGCDKGRGLQRAEWITAQLKKGHTTKEIAAALNIAVTTLYGTAAHHGHRIGDNKPRTETFVKKVSKCGVKLGFIGPELNKLDTATQEHLLNECARTGQTISELLVSYAVQNKA